MKSCLRSNLVDHSHYSVFDRKKLLAFLIPANSCNFHLRMKSLTDLKIIQLSRFAYIRNCQSVLALESPLVAAIIYLKDLKCLEIIHALSQPETLDDLTKKFKRMNAKNLMAFLSLLHRACFLTDADDDPFLQTWEFHDLLFHAKSRLGRHSAPAGGTFRFLKKIPPCPAIRSSKDGGIPLYIPDMEALMKESRSFTQILEDRKSIREQAKEPISIEMLGEFLYRTARVKERRKRGCYEATSRPYPNGGACYELEIYLAISQCKGIFPGLYYYQSDSHLLHERSKWGEKVEELLQAALFATKQKRPLPQVLILIAARFQRRSWKYESTAYAGILKNAGVLIQTMYLVATAMDLAPCAIGGGNSDLFAEIAQTNYYDETTVAEFILGSKKKGP